MNNYLSRATKYFGLLIFSAIFLAGCSSVHDQHHAEMGGDTPTYGRAQRIDWLSFDEGQKRAREEGKLMVVDFYVAEGCHRCDVMAVNIWSNPKVAAMMNERFIPVRVDLEYSIPKGALVIGKQYDFNYECLLVVCDAEGNAVRDDTSGRMCFSEAVQPDWFISYLEQAAAKAMGSASGGAKDFFSDME